MKLIFSSLLAIVLLGACTTTPSTNTDTDSSRQITRTELGQHNTPSDCWLAIDGSVYDVTSFISTHPGGAEITRGCGMDATSLYNTKGGEGIPHSGSAESIKQGLLIGTLTD